MHDSLASISQSMSLVPWPMQFGLRLSGRYIFLGPGFIKLVFKNYILGSTQCWYLAEDHQFIRNAFIAKTTTVLFVAMGVSVLFIWYIIHYGECFTGVVSTTTGDYYFPSPLCLCHSMCMLPVSICLSFSIYFTPNMYICIYIEREKERERKRQNEHLYKWAFYFFSSC